MKLFEFFREKGLAALKREDHKEQWYEDWIAYQAEHRLYADLLCPEDALSPPQYAFDLLRYARFLELFAYFSPAHGYSLQVTFLGLFPILMGANARLKEEAVETLRVGGVLGLGVSEKAHGSDLLGNEFTVREGGPGRLVADGSKYYIGNANCASILSVLARRVEERPERARRAPFVLLALRPRKAKGFHNLRKIRTLGVRSAFVGEFEVKNEEVDESDVIAEGRGAWDAVIGTVTLGKFFLGFGSIGICEHALEEAAAHLRARILYGKPAIELPHLRSAMARTYARITAMKLYAYRALDYVRSASDVDRRYLLFCAVQKAKVSTEGLRAMELLLDCIGAKGFESDTYFEMALRDAQLIPRLEGSTHINLALTAQFIPRYFAQSDPDVPEPGSMTADSTISRKNPYLITARAGAIHAVGFPPYLTAYRPLMSVPNVRIFAVQASALRLFLRSSCAQRALKAAGETALALGQCLATVAYGQLVAENAVLLGVPHALISVMFELFVTDLSSSALALAGSPHVDSIGQALIRRLVVPAKTTLAEWDAVAARAVAFGGS